MKYIRKTLQDVESYLKGILVPEAHEAHAINPMYAGALVEEVYYPFLHNVGTMLKSIGYYSKLIENAQSLVCGNVVFNGKLSVTKNLECLRFLAECGICLEGIDLNDKKQNLSDIKTIKISYPDNLCLIQWKCLRLHHTSHVETKPGS